MSQHWLFMYILYHLFKVNIMMYISTYGQDPLQYREIYLNY